MPTTDSPALPSGFPDQLYGPAVWSKHVDEQEYVCQLTESDINSIESALQHFQVSSKLRYLSHDVHSGRGFSVIRGLDPEKYTEEENVIIYGGVASYVGRDRADMIWLFDRAGGSLTQENQAKFPPNELTSSMDFHTDVDAGDILSLFTMRLSKTGGQQYLTSFWSVYNDLAQHNPEVLQVLASDWRYEMKKQQGVQVINRPIIYCVDNKVQINFATAFLKGSSYIPRQTDSPDLTVHQEEAIKILLQVSRKHSMRLSQASGDMLFVNNLCILHAREFYPELAWRKPTATAIEMGKKFAKLDVPQFMGTVEHYEDFRNTFALLRHD
uniref:TauD/TfdA-like domain-containing protein n=1 Tax=Bionectria ochroleuca TaxID=29856 RepID=A0A8H7K6Q5_BIOOC